RTTLSHKLYRLMTIFTIAGPVVPYFLPVLARVLDLQRGRGGHATQELDALATNALRRHTIPEKSFRAPDAQITPLVALIRPSAQTILLATQSPRH
ncbi:MAG: hypothetical protein JXM79_24085, partial [Sedimentisphaerales bacterium]|nr:hypothetical protein [Sedimentisphaerales bacterium]